MPSAASRLSSPGNRRAHVFSMAQRASAAASQAALARRLLAVRVDQRKDELTVLGGHAALLRRPGGRPRVLPRDEGAPRIQ